MGSFVGGLHDRDRAQLGVARLLGAAVGDLAGELAATAQAAERRASARTSLQGRPVKVVDGSSVQAPDTAANQKEYPQPSGQQPGHDRQGDGGDQLPTGTGGEGVLRIFTADASWVIDSRSFLTANYTHFANETLGKPDFTALRFRASVSAAFGLSSSLAICVPI